MNVVACVPDLMDRSKVSAAVPSVTFVTPAQLAGALAGADVVLVDLSRPAVLDALAAAGLDAGDARGQPRLVGFASHVDDATLARARSLGCEALPRSRFFRDVARLVDPR